MREIKITRKSGQEYVALVDDADYQRVIDLGGVWRVNIPYRVVYARHNSGVFLHRFIMGITDGKIHVDHIDGNGLNCQRQNLRTCTNSQNHQNIRKYTTRKTPASSQYKGVYRSVKLGKWGACIFADEKQRHLGFFIDETEAARAYDTAARQYFGAFAHCNFP
jgi:hypothetical protein